MNERDYNLLADTVAVAIEAAYLDQIDDVTQALVIAEVVRAVENDDTDGILALMVGLLGFVAFTEAMRRAFLQGGQAQIDSIPRNSLARAIAASLDPSDGGRLVVTPQRPILPGFLGQPIGPALPTWTQSGEFKQVPAKLSPVRPKIPPFNPRQPAAAEAISTAIDKAISDIQVAQRAAVSETVAAGRAAGRTARQIALDVAGRVQAGGRRSGGVIGLGEGDAKWLLSTRAQLESGNPALLKQYLTRSLRDRRFDAAVRKAIESGKPVLAGVVDRAVGRYSDRLLRHRGEVLSQLSARQAIGAGRYQAIAQLVDQGVLSESNIRKRWITEGDNKVREQHRAMDEQEKPLNQPFVSPTGIQAMYPGDGSLNAPDSFRINCRCHVAYEL